MSAKGGETYEAEDAESGPFDADGCAEGDAGQQQQAHPSPGGEGLASHGEKEGEGEHAGEEQHAVDEDEAGLDEERPVEEDYGGGEQGCGAAAAELADEDVGDGDHQCAEQSGDGAHGEVDGVAVGVADGLESEAGLEAAYPSGEGDEHLAEGGMDVEEVLAGEVAAGEAAEMEFVEDNLVGLGESPEAGEEGEEDDEPEGPVVAEEGEGAFL